MVWVRSEYAGELAVLSAWFAAVIPWNVTYSTGILGGSLLFIRFPFFQVQYGWGVSVAEINGLTVWGIVGLGGLPGALAAQEGQTMYLAYQVWAVGAAFLAAAVLLSIAYYTREQQVENGPVDPVRLMGALLFCSGVVLAVANYLVVTRGFPGIPLPIGTLVLLALGGILLRVERLNDPESVGDETVDGETVDGKTADGETAEDETAG